jgi:hypothetical protein
VLQRRRGGRLFQASQSACSSSTDGPARLGSSPASILDELRDAAERHHLTFGPDPSTHDHNTLGGMIGNNSCGVHSVMAGRTADNVEAARDPDL